MKSIERTAVVKVRDILLVTVPTDLDDPSISFIQEEILSKMERYQPHGVILDLSIVESLDSFFARTIVETSQMVALMGGKTVIAGMSPAVAITVVQLGLTMGNTAAALDVDRALDLLEFSGAEAGEEDQ
jgi:rsbT antagonist protein RsbS